jgi:hypothetical protein
VVRESVVGTFGVGACVEPTVVGIFVCIVLVMFCTSMWTGAVQYVILMRAVCRGTLAVLSWVLPSIVPYCTCFLALT